MSIKQNITNLQSLLEQVNTLPDAEGVKLPPLTNEGSSNDLLSGKELIDSNGNVITGTFTLDSELSTQDSLISQIQNALDGKIAINSSIKSISAASGGSFVLDADSTSTYYYITHDLGRIPNFFCVYAAESKNNVNTFAGNYLFLYVHLHYPFQVANKSPMGVAFSYFGNADGSSASTTTTTLNEMSCTSDKLSIYLNTRKFKAGVKYNWTCCVIDEL